MAVRRQRAAEVDTTPAPEAAGTRRPPPLLAALAGTALASVALTLIGGSGRELAPAPLAVQAIAATLLDLLGIAVLFVAVFTVAARGRLRPVLAQGYERGLHRAVPARLAATVAVLVALSLLQLADLAPAAGGWRIAGVFVWIAAAALVLLQLLAELVPVRDWRPLLGEQRGAALFALGACLAWLATPALRLLWEPLGGLTFDASGALLGRFYDGVVIDPEARRLAVGGFQVRIDAPCSGYEGMGLLTAFLGGYCWLFRRELRFPWALLLLPVGAALAWLANVVRIAALVAIGASYSPQVAIDGFHSQAGWIAFVLLAIGTVVVAHHLPWLSARPPLAAAGTFAAGQRSEALLLPLVALLAATLLTSALSAGFDWAYPLRVVATAGALWLGRRHYRLAEYRLAAWPLGIGVAVFALWIALVPPSPPADAVVSKALESTAGAVALAWILARVLGAAIAVPIAEELAFRGYLLARLVGRDGGAREVPFSWPALAISSLAFGALHSTWVAGTLAGAAFAVARYRRGELGDAIVAHAVTNGLLSLYVLATGHWSLW